MTRRIIAAVLVLGVAGAAGIFFWFQQAPREETASWQGWIEADSLFVGPDMAGRLSALQVARGDRIEEGAPLFAVESDMEAAELAASQAAVAQARAQLASAEAPRQRPQEIDVLRAQEAAAMAAVEAAKLAFQRTKTLSATGATSTAAYDQARTALDRDTAQLAQVRNRIEVAKLPARAQDIEAAREALVLARARRDQVALQQRRRSVAAPASGTIQEIYFRVGEVVGAGKPVVSLLPPGALRVRFFVPETEISSLSPGDAVTITCDECPPVAARIDFIAQEAEYTPPVIYSLEERAKLVFRIEAVPQTPRVLRVGQPVTVSRGAP